MRVRVKYYELKDISIILHELSEYKLEIKSDYFILKNSDTEIYFTTENDEFINPDAKRTNFDELKFDKVLQVSCDAGRFEDTNDIFVYTSADEPLMNDVHWLKEFLDNGNYVITSTKLVNFQHQNLFTEISLIFPFVFHNAGFAFLNYYRNLEKEHLIGSYMGEAHKFHNRHQRYSEFQEIQKLSNYHLKDYLSVEYPHKELIHSLPIENKMSLCNWKKNYISSYTDFNNCVSFYVNESETDEDGEFIRLTEKTVKSLLFSKSYSFVLWRGTNRVMNLLHDYGFWFLNSEFYEKDVFESIKKSAIFLSNKLDEFNSTSLVYSYLLEKYKDKLDNNSKLIDSMINSPSTNFFEKIIKNI